MSLSMMPALAEAPDPSPHRARNVRHVTVLALLLVAAVLAAYAPALHGDFIWDDDVYVTENTLLRAPDGLGRIWFSRDFESQYFPLTITVLRFAYQAWGLQTLGYHLLNVALHLVNVALVYVLLVRLGVAGAGFAAAIFALHPVQVESVAWITEIKNVLSTAFYLLALLAYLRFDDRRGARWYVLAAVLFVLGLLAKTMVCTFPGVVLVLLWWRGRRIGLREVALLAPFVVVGVGMGLLSAWYEVAHIGTTGAEFQLHPSERLLVAGRAPWFYLGKLLAPVGLAFSYPRWNLDPRDPWQWGWPLALLAAALLLWGARHRVGRGPAAGLACFVVVLSPLLGFVNYYTMRYSFVADHYQYLACVGPIAVAAAAMTILVRESTLGSRVLPVAVLGILAALTWRQAHAYRDPISLWRDTLAKNPGSWMAHNNLGNHLTDRGTARDIDEALEHYEASRRLNPQYADPLNNIGHILVRRGQAAEAIPLLEQAIALDPGNADFGYNLGSALAAAGRTDEAVATFRATLKHAPGHYRVHNNLANLLLERGDVQEAIEHYRMAVALAPDDATVHENLGAALAAAGAHEDAVREYRAALALRPAAPSAVAGLAEELAALGRVEEALSAYEDALADAPTDVTLRYDFAVQLTAVGRPAAAVEQYREVLRRAPDDAEAAGNLGAALLALGRAAEAVAVFEDMLRRNPGNADAGYNLAVALWQAGLVERGLAVAEAGLAGAPDDFRFANFLAWIRATAADARWRDPEEAIRLAEYVDRGTGHRNSGYLDTLGAAYAAAGRFEDAVRVTEEALAIASPTEGAALRDRVALYRARQPYREEGGP